MSHGHQPRHARSRHQLQLADLLLCPRQADLRLEQIAIQPRQEQITIRLERSLPPSRASSNLPSSASSTARSFWIKPRSRASFLPHSVQPRIDSARFFVLSLFRKPASLNIRAAADLDWATGIGGAVSFSLRPRATSAAANRPQL